MKQIFSMIAMAFAFGLVQGQEPVMEWAKGFGGSDDDRGNKITLDAKGNAIITGRFYSKDIIFGSFRLENITQDSTKADAFVAKFSPDGKIFWAKRFGGLSDDHALHASTDKQGNIVVIGGFDSEYFVVDDKRFANNTEKGKGGDVFIIKLSSDGKVLWTKTYGGEKHDCGYDTCITDDDGNTYLAGSFYSQELVIDDVTLINSGKGSETYIAKFNADGKVLWVKSAHGFDDDTMPQSCSLDTHGNLIIGGYYTGTSMVFEKDTLNNSDEKLFIAKYDTDGSLVWAKAYAGIAGTIATDAGSNILFSGVFCDSLIVMGGIQLISHGGCDVFLAKLDSEGNIQWAKNAGGEGMDGVRNFCVDKKGNIIVTGSFNSPFMVLDDVKIKSTGEKENIFIAFFSSNGQAQWAKSAGGSGRNAGRSCDCNSNGNVYITGSFEEPSLVLEKTTPKNAGNADVFIVKIANGGK